LRTAAGQVGQALPPVRRIVGESEHTIVESNSLLQFLKPDLCLMAVDGAVADFKATSLRIPDRADALVVTSPAALAWPGVAAGSSPASRGSKPWRRNTAVMKFLMRSG
jgi:hypothetical protein